MNHKTNFLMITAALGLGLLVGCTTYHYEPVNDTAKFYEDKLGCETKYSPGYDMFGNRSYGDIYSAGPARDCMLAKGYKTLP